VLGFLGQFYGRRAATELEARSRREEVLRNLRWAAELAVSEDRDKSALGIEELGALRDYSEILSRTEAGFIAAALRVATQGPREAIGESGGDYKIVRDTDTDAIEGGDVSSEEGEEPEDGGLS
jgi:hypothetical protein